MIDLADKRGELYKEQQQPKNTAFTGTGHSLQGPSTTTTSSINNINNNNTIDNANNKTIEIDNTKGTTSIQIRCSDGQRIIVTVNETHTVLDIRNHLNSVKPSSFSYDFMTTFPQQIITNENQTVKEAGLLNSVIVQKPK